MEFTENESLLLKKNGWVVYGESATKKNLTLRKEGVNNFWLGTESMARDCDGDLGFSRSWSPYLTFIELCQRINITSTIVEIQRTP